MKMRMTRGMLALACAAGMLPTLTAPGAVSAAPIKCWGKPATIVSGAETVRGTPGDDVIVTTGRIADVVARGGDDTVCARGRRGLTTVNTGAGDDRVRIEARTTAYAELRGDADTYVGGPGEDVVFSGARTGQRNDDRIRLGAGADSLGLLGGGRTPAIVQGGPGRDEIAVEALRGPVIVDAVARRATHRGRPHSHWRGFESHLVSGSGRLSFLGTDAKDDVTFLGDGTVVATTLGGDDRITLPAGYEQGLRLSTRAVPRPQASVPDQSTLRSFVSRPSLSGRSARSQTPTPVLDPGEGLDVLELLIGGAHVAGDLTTDQLVVKDEVGAVVAALTIPGFEGLTASSWAAAPGLAPTSVELVGDDGTNRLKGNACHVVLRGGGGDDHLRVGSDALPELLFSPMSELCALTSEVHGDAGNDTLVSRMMEPDFRRSSLGRPLPLKEVRARDVLDGGEGTDTARAGKGRDTCLAEVQVDCEA